MVRSRVCCRTKRVPGGLILPNDCDVRSPLPQEPPESLSVPPSPNAKVSLARHFICGRNPSPERKDEVVRLQEVLNV